MKVKLLAISSLFMAATIGAAPINITQDMGYKAVEVHLFPWQKTEMSTLVAITILNSILKPSTLIT